MSTCYVEHSPPETAAISIPPPPPEPPGLTKHADLWFCDGSVILEAESTLFRVHKSQLSRRSIVFSDMFALAQPTTHATFADETYEGCPVVKLYDSAEDVANLLLALYDGPFVPCLLFFHIPVSVCINTSTNCTCRKFGNNDPHDFAIVAGILRLSTKYVIDSLRSKAIAHLNIAWPTTLKGWDIREDKVHASELTSPTEHASLYPSPVVCRPSCVPFESSAVVNDALLLGCYQPCTPSQCIKPAARSILRHLTIQFCTDIRTDRR
jgi:hypothetical protein